MEQRCLNPRGGTPDLKWQGWSKDFGGFEIFDFGVGKLWQGFSFGGGGGVHDLSRNFLGVFKTIWRFVIVPAYAQPCSFVNKVNQESKFLWLRNSAWGFWGVKFWSRDFIGFYLKPRGFFGVLIFAPINILIIHVTWNPENPPWCLNTSVLQVNRLKICSRLHGEKYCTLKDKEDFKINTRRFQDQIKISGDHWFFFTAFTTSVLVIIFLSFYIFIQYSILALVSECPCKLGLRQKVKFCCVLQRIVHS